jgi:tetratricopeptide (TPR) repeat protein
LIKLGRIFEAFEILSNLEKRFPEDPTILNELGIVMRELGLFEDSVERLEKAYEISKDEGMKYNLARSAMFVDRERAREMLEELGDGEYSFRAKDLLEYLDKKNEIPLNRTGEIGGLSLEISICEDLPCILKDIELEGEIGERVEMILEGFVPKGSEIDTVELLELAAAYILTGKDFVDMERKATEFAVGVYGSGVMMGVVRVILRAVQMRSDLGGVLVDHLVESVVPEIQDLHWNLALKISRSLETVPISYPSRGSEFITSLLYYLKFPKDVPEVYRPWIDLLLSR